MTEFLAALDRLEAGTVPSPDDLELALAAKGPEETAALFARADRVRRREIGDGVLLRGLVEFSSHCGNSCFYCGLNRDNRNLTRYRLSSGQILACVDEIARRNIGTVVLQSGEDGTDAGFIADIVSEVKRRYGLAVTLSVGERPREDYRLWRTAGADRYLLRIESSDRTLYEALHRGRSWDSRLRCLRELRELGYQVGSGIMVGVPGQTPGILARDIAFFRDMDFDMIGIGPFIPHPDTPLRDAPAGDVDLTLRVVALTRIVTRNAHLPATTALGSMGQDYRVDGLRAGANVIMPNFTPAVYKRLYEIYPGKRCVSEPTGACALCMEGLAAAAGLHIDPSRGDSLKAGTRPRPA